MYVLGCSWTNRQIEKAFLRHFSKYFVINLYFLVNYSFKVPHDGVSPMHSKYLFQINILSLYVLSGDPFHTDRLVSTVLKQLALLKNSFIRAVWDKSLYIFHWLISTEDEENTEWQTLKIMWDLWMPVCLFPRNALGHDRVAHSPASTEREKWNELCSHQRSRVSTLSHKSFYSTFSHNVSPVLMCKIFERISLEDSACHEAVWLKMTVWHFLIFSWGFSYSFGWSRCSRWVMIIKAVCFLNKQHWPSVITCLDPISVVIPESTKIEKKNNL